MELISQAEWARRHGFSRQYANQLVQEGIIPLEDGKINPETADIILEAIKDPSQPQRRANGKPSQKSLSKNTDLPKLLLQTRIKNEIERGKILEARAKAETGELVNAEDVKKAAFTKARVIRDGLLNIPDRMASVMASTNDEQKVHELLSQEIRMVLEDLSHDD
jgi:hypothetical protein